VKINSPLFNHLRIKRKESFQLTINKAIKYNRATVRDKTLRTWDRATKKTSYPFPRANLNQAADPILKLERLTNEKARHTKARQFGEGVKIEQLRCSWIQHLLPSKSAKSIAILENER